MVRAGSETLERRKRNQHGFRPIANTFARAID
jgi:hypothetical protein